MYIYTRAVMWVISVVEIVSTRLAEGVLTVENKEMVSGVIKRQKGKNQREERNTYKKGQQAGAQVGDAKAQ